MNYSNASSAIIQYRIPDLNLEWTVMIPFYCLIFVLAVVGNLIVIVTLVQNKRMRTVTNMFLLNLAISDLLIAILCMPFNTITYILHNFVFGKFVCISVRYLQGVLFCVNCFTLVAISLERYFGLCRPLHSRKWQTISHSHKIITICWVLSFILVIPSAIHNRYIEQPYGNYLCREIWDDIELEKGYQIILVISLLVAPIIIMTIAYSRIAFTLWMGMKLDPQSGQEIFGLVLEPARKPGKDPCEKTTSSRLNNANVMRTSNGERIRSSKKRVVKMLFVVVFEFFIFWTPSVIVQSWITIDNKSAVYYVTNEISSAFLLLSYASTCCNPITYCFMNRSFRQGFLSAFKCCRRRHLNQHSRCRFLNRENENSNKNSRVGSVLLSKRVNMFTKQNVSWDTHLCDH